MSDTRLQDVLNNLPLNQITEFDGARICLRLFPDGAVLQAEVGNVSTPYGLQTLLEQGFSSALLFDAGIAIDASSKALVLTQWLPNVQTWHAAEIALEQLLNQLDLCQSLLGNTLPALPKATSRTKDELRFRALLSR